MPSRTKGTKGRLLVNGKSNFVWQTRAQLSKVAEQASVCKRIASHSLLPLIQPIIVIGPLLVLLVPPSFVAADVKSNPLLLDHYWYY